MRAPTGTTLLAGVVGHPVRHSLSPVIHNAAFEAVGADWVSVAWEVEPSGLAAFVRGARVMGVGGWSVTTPHKRPIMDLLDGVTPQARRLDAVNCVVVDDGALVGHNTDGIGLVDAVRHELELDPDGARCVVLGAGGAARAVISGLADAGAAEILVVNRTAARADRAAELAPGRARRADPSEIAGTDLVVNATSVGMAGTDQVGRSPLGEGELAGAGALVDLVYHPRTTPLLAQAERSGVRHAGGVGMLVHQARHQLERWTGAAVPVEPLLVAVEERLDRDR